MLLSIQLRNFQYCVYSRINVKTIRSLSIKSKERRKYQQQKYENKNDDSNLPEFQVLLRQLYKKSHPDLLRSSFPSESIINDNSMQLLNSVLTAIKSTDEMPPAMKKIIPFYVKTAQNEVKVVTLNINTSGGYSKNNITSTFETFFLDCGITTSSNKKFQWNEEYFPRITS